ncbi:MAG: serine hydrolase domain-containing protein [Solirubrobacteraceae bacterium]
MTRHSRLTLSLATAAAVLAPGLLAPAVSQATPTTDASVQKGLQQLVAARGGPPGAVATLYRSGHLTVLRAGRANVKTLGAPTATQHMRIASIAKAFSAAIALHLVQEGRLSLDDTIGQWLPSLPKTWASVTIRELLNHTSGIPDYTKSEAFAKQARSDPQGYVTPNEIIDWVRKARLAFTPGSRYEYSNTDNIVVGLIAQSVTHMPYPALVRSIVFQPAGLTQTTFPTRRIPLPAPFIHGYVVEPGEAPADVTNFLSPSGAWASGAIVSTPKDLGTFIRADLGQKFFGAAEQQQQMQFVPGSSSPAGPGVNYAGLGLFRYRTRCGTVYGHTGNFPGYTQFAAATADGSRSVTTTLNIPAPTGKLLMQLRAVQASAVCALLSR